MGSDGATGASPVRVAVDAMGGDYGPQETVKGALGALGAHDIELLLVGDRDRVEAELAHYDLAGKPVTVIPSVDKIGDDEHPVNALRAKPQASILVATKPADERRRRRSGFHGPHRGVDGQCGAVPWYDGGA